MNAQTPQPAAAPPSATASVPSGRWSRMARMGTLATGLAGGMLAEGARQWAQGKRQHHELLLAPANARRVADQLAQLRGAAMKVRQLLSMDAGELLPPELGEILARLRSDAKPMPIGQMDEVLTAAWGAGWDATLCAVRLHPHRRRLDRPGAPPPTSHRRAAGWPSRCNTPAYARASPATWTTWARCCACRACCLPIWMWRRSWPRPRAAARRSRLSARSPLPGAVCSPAGRRAKPAHSHRTRQHWTTENVLAMDYVECVPIESLQRAPQAQRDEVASTLMGLLFRELFEFRLVQTKDPNFANYRYDKASGRTVLLDFGATRAYGSEVVEAYRRLMRAAMHGHREGMDEAAQAIGYFGHHIQPHQRNAVIDLFALACEPLRHADGYDFGTSDLAQRIRTAGMALSTEKDLAHPTSRCAVLAPQAGRDVPAGCQAQRPRYRCRRWHGRIWSKAELASSALRLKLPILPDNKKPAEAGFLVNRRMAQRKRNWGTTCRSPSTEAR